MNNEFDILKHPLRAGRQSLIEASAGTGKTTALENLVLRLLIEGLEQADGNRKRIEISDILLLTFTEAATSELVRRVRENIVQALELLKERKFADADGIVAEILRHSLQHGRPENEITAALRMALLNFDENTIATIHGFCRKMLNDFTFESRSRFNLELTSDDRPYREEVVSDYWRSNFYNISSKIEEKIFKAEKWNPGALRRLLDQIQSSPFIELDFCTEIGGRAGLLEKTGKLYKELEAYCRHDKLLYLLMAKTTNFGKAYREKLENALSVYNAFGDVFELVKLLTREKLEKNILNKACWDGFKDAVPEKGKLPRDFAEIINLTEALGNCFSKYISQLKYDFVAYLRKSGILKNKKLADNVLSFDDLLLDMYAAVNQSDVFCELIRREFPVVMLDEFQDTDPVQFSIFERVFQHDEVLLLMVGDPKQSIYQFRGADIYSYLRVSEKLPADDKKSLTRNYRSTPALLAGINTVFNVKNPFIEEAIGHIPAVSGRKQSKLIIEGQDNERPLLIMHNSEGLSKEAALKLFSTATVDRIVDILSLALQKDTEGRPLARFEYPDGRIEPVRARDIAILTARNKDAQAICELLAAAGVHSTLQQSGNVFKSDEATALLIFLNAVIQPGNPDRVRSALATDFFQLDTAALAALRDEDNALMEGWQESFLELFRQWQERGFIRMFSAFLRPLQVPGQTAVFAVRKKLLSLPRGERRLTNLLHLGELLHQQSTRLKLGPAALIYWLHQQINDPEEREEHELRLESDESAVRIMTVHKSKGLQFPLVFCLNLWQQNCASIRNETNFIYHRDYQQYLELETAGAEFERKRLQYRRERLSELLRLSYVALTRARNFCCFTWGNINQSDASALGYLSIAPAVEDLENLILDGKFSGERHGWGKWRQDTHIRIEEINADEFGGGCKSMLIDNIAAPVWRPLPEIKPFPRDWGIMSFSAITEGSHEENDFRSGIDDEETEKENELLAKVETDLFSGQLPLGDFPHGPLAGNCIHAIFEQLDFALVKNKNWRDDKELEQILKHKLDIGGLAGEDSEAERLKQLGAMLENVLNYPLPGHDGTIRLCDLPDSAYRRELQFFFPAAKLLESVRVNRLIKHLSGQNAALTAMPLRGFVNGFIDLVFESGGRYYIVDWKSNDLGGSLNDYNEAGLARSMVVSHYHLQAAIYLLALDKLLKNRLPGYNFAEHIGGIFYLYVRGMNRDFPGTGVYHIAPDSRTLELTRDIFEG